MTNSPFKSAMNLTAKRKEYQETMFENAIRQVAADLSAGNTTREVGVNAVANAIAAAVPHTGKGHAETIREYVDQQVDSILAEQESKTKAKA